VSRRVAGASVLVAVMVAGMSSCQRYPESYPPPEQRQPLTAAEAGEEKSFVEMNAADAASYFVRDVRGLEANQWRWTGQRPTLHFVLDQVENLKFVMDFAVAGAVLEQTGPLTVSFRINGRLLARETYATHGEKHFEKPVQASWLEAGGDTIVSAELDKVWVSPTDGVKLGIILKRAGFVKR